ncbi:hypothetical protein MJI95_37950, partial [Salmonella enterica subsp. enterica serovar Kentucky]|nr:hypothetical protein [Salmonella enterica subsp. enterica serovar Kentucky]
DSILGVNLIMRRGLIMLQSNEYFSGKVKSIGFTSSSIGRASVASTMELKVKTLKYFNELEAENIKGL